VFKRAFNSEMDEFLANCLDDYQEELDRCRFGEKMDGEFNIELNPSRVKVGRPEERKT